MKNTIEVTFTVFFDTTFKVKKFNLPLKMASKVAPNAPTPAASVGVANPPKIEPNTAIINTTGGSRFFRAV